MKIESFRLNDRDLYLLNKFMEENNFKNKSVAIRECIKRSVAINDTDTMLFDLNNKINRLIHNQYLTKKLLEQLFTNLKFSKNSDIKSNEVLKEFYESFDKYRDNFLI